MAEQERVGITPKSWTVEFHHGVLHLGKRWYVVSAEVDGAGHADGVRLDGPYPDHESAEAQARRMRDSSSSPPEADRIDTGAAQLSRP